MNKPKSMNRSAAEIVAFHLGWEIGEMRETRYQPTAYPGMAIYAVDDTYFCCPVVGKKPKYGDQYPWKPLADYYGRTVYGCTVDEITKHQNLD
jgi:hypothetical protein